VTLKTVVTRFTATKQISLPQHQAVNINIPIMNLSTMPADILLYLMKFMKPVDKFNLLLSGILKGFENVNLGIGSRIENCEIALKLRPDSTDEFEIR
jgi:hypothetical protein